MKFLNIFKYSLPVLCSYDGRLSMLIKYRKETEMTIWYIKILCIFFSLILIIGVFIFVRVRKQRNTFLTVNTSQKAADLDHEFASWGFFYSPEDDAFYSIENAPQREFGNCQLYDDSMPLVGIIVDCEPIYFEYDNKLWLIEFWKGQYGMALGCQIGTYFTLSESIKYPGFQQIYYESPSNKECCGISFTLKKKNKMILRHTSEKCFTAGLKLGEFSNPSALTLKAKITFPNKKMLLSFIGGLKAAGYASNEYSAHFNKVIVYFTKPHTTQPASRTGVQEAIIQQGNRAGCYKFTQLTSKCNNTLEKLELLKSLDSELYEKVIKSFYSKELYCNRESIDPLHEKL